MSLQPLLKKTFRTHIISRYCNKTCTVCFSVLCTLCITKRVLNAKCIRMRLTIGFLPDPVGKFTALPQTLSWIKEEEPKRMEWKEKWGRKRERKKMEGRLILNAFSSIGLCYIVTVKSDEVNGVRLSSSSLLYTVLYCHDCYRKQRRVVEKSWWVAVIAHWAARAHVRSFPVDNVLSPGTSPAAYAHTAFFVQTNSHIVTFIVS